METDVQEPVSPALTPTDMTLPQGADPARVKVITAWVDRIKRSADHHGKAFKRMDKCMKIAAQGTEDDEWAASSYVVPVLTRHINVTVAQLYAKHPETIVKRKERMLYQLWDGKQETAAAALQAVQAGDVTQLPILEDIAQAQQYIMLLDRISKSMQICWEYFMGEQEYDYKSQLKAMVRRTKVCGVGYVKLGFQRAFEPNPEITARIGDVTSKLALIERLAEEGQEDPRDDEGQNAEQLRTLLADLQNDKDIIVREGPVLSFPRSKDLIIDKNCRHLKTLAGARFVAEVYDLDPEEIEEIYKVDVKDNYTKFTKKDSGGKEMDKCRVYEIWDRKARQALTVCEGYHDYLKEPKTPDVNLERFWPHFPLVFNEIESEDELYPPSDVWLARHPQEEINRSRQGLREHRIANRPWYAARHGALEEKDKTRLSDHAAHELVELHGLGPGDEVGKLIQRGPSIAIDPAQYDVEGHFQDILRTVGSQEANLGPTSGATATETSIAENSRQSGQSDNIDDLDDLLTNLARSGGQLMLQELSKETVIEIAGPGAAWPEYAGTRSEIVKDLALEIEAGSSGRPNRAAELADMERAAPTLIQLPGVNPKPFVKKYFNLLNIDLDEGIVEGMPSIQAVNALLAKPAAQPSTGDPATDPAAQGDKGGQNAPAPAGGQNQSQPAYPAPASGMAPAGGLV